MPDVPANTPHTKRRYSPTDLFRRIILEKNTQSHSEDEIQMAHAWDTLQKATEKSWGLGYYHTQRVLVMIHPPKDDHEREELRTSLLEHFGTHAAKHGRQTIRDIIAKKAETLDKEREWYIDKQNIFFTMEELDRDKISAYDGTPLEVRKPSIGKTPPSTESREL